ncbi:TonB-dependent receptor domain-containing protein [Paeniroseomonas aquatica]|uniref:TonB-dependent receptor domain-containing protein n=1 Tax=Paeniroseomonas aquatica TaxID=373043 RepID=UPI0036141C69
MPGLESRLAAFVLTLGSEILFLGDAGTTEPSRASRRIGLEWTNRYQARPWLAFDLDVAATRARFTEDDPAGRYIPGAPNLVLAAGMTVDEGIGWFGTTRLRYFGARPLTEDNSQQSRATALVNARLGYRFENGLRMQLDAFNLFDSKASQIDYFYASRLPGEPGGGVEDRHFHPAEPGPALHRRRQPVADRRQASATRPIGRAGACAAGPSRQSEEKKAPPKAAITETSHIWS